MNMLNRELFKGLNISEQFQPSTWFTSFTPKPCEHACAHASESNRERERERERERTILLIHEAIDTLPITPFPILSLHTSHPFAPFSTTNLRTP
jgi:hypothetical protein